jgi:sugar phosphate isomerase/epimerase
MKKYSRRNFLQNTGGFLALATMGNKTDFKKDKVLLSFSTLGCPDWSFEKIVNFAAENGYDGLEIRTIQRQMDLPKCSEFRSSEKIAATMQFLKDKGIRIANLGSSAAMHYAEAKERQKNIDEAKRFIDLAQKLNCPYIRVFPNDFPENQDHNKTIDLIATGLLELGNYAKGSDVAVLLESHGQVVKSDDLETIMRAAEHKHVGLIWDIVNMWSVTKEPPGEVYQRLKKYIRHTHIKDLKIVDGKEQYTLLGKGETPIFDAIDALTKGGYEGYFSFEWEKLWHPEIAEPEIALAEYPKTMKAHFKNA